jgi:hypothetical protein
MIFSKKIREVTEDPPIRDVKVQTAFYPSSASVKVIDPDLGIPKVIGASSGCLRRQYYDITGVTPTSRTSAEGSFKMWMGGLIQGLFENQIKKAGLWMDSEVRMWIPKYKVSGRVDTWCWDPESLKPGHPRIPIPIEFKSTGRFGESGQITITKGKLMPHGEHVCQVMPYLDFYSQWPEWYHGQPMRIVIFVVSRDSMNWREHVVSLGGKGKYGDDIKDDERYAIVRNDMGTFQLKHITMAGIYSRYMQVAEHLRQKNVPGRDFQLQYGNERIKRMADKELMSKTDIKKVAASIKRDPKGNDRWLGKMEKPYGDWQCAYCPYTMKCYQGLDHTPKPVIKQDLPQVAAASKPPITEPTAGL